MDQSYHIWQRCTDMAQIFACENGVKKHEVPKPLVADAAPTMQTVCLNESAPYPFVFATFFSCNQKCIRSIRKKEKKGGSSTGNMPQGYAFQGACSQQRTFSGLRALLGERSRGCAHSWENVLGGCSLWGAQRASCMADGAGAGVRAAGRWHRARGERNAGRSRRESARGGLPKAPPPPPRASP